MTGVPWQPAVALDAKVFSALRRRTILEHCKWDPQVGDVATLAPFPVILTAPAWRCIAAAAEALADEVVEAETVLLRRPRLVAGLGLPGALVRLWQNPAPSVPAPRIMRFDFHWTSAGWRISEVNSDVPGGYSESTDFTALMADHSPHARPTGAPGQAWADALSAHGQSAVLLSSPGLPEDQQVNSYLGQLLRHRGVSVHLAGPQQLRWHNGYAFFQDAPIDIVWRFFQAEWLPRLARGTGWTHYFNGNRTPVSNSGQAILSESKRFPLVWDRLGLSLPWWRRLLPETCEPRHVPWQTDDAWMIKAAFCCTGESVHSLATTAPVRWKQVVRQVHRDPRAWVAQRRFDTVPVETPLGPMRACFGVYTVNGRAQGCYGRLTAGPVIDFQAVDVAVLVAKEERDDPG